MDKKLAENLITDTFCHPFNEEKFELFTENLFGSLDSSSKTNWLDHPLKDNNQPNQILKYKIYGHFKDINNDKILILIVKTSSGRIVEHSRSLQRKFAKDLIIKTNSDACLVAFYAEDYSDWRYSLIRIEYKRSHDSSGKLKIKSDLTPLKRYSYLVGKNEPSYTAQSQLAPLLYDDKKISLNKIADAFSVEKLSDQFFLDYKNLCFEVSNELKSILKKDYKVKIEFEKIKLSTFDYAKKFMGQIIFIYFIQKKGWIGIDENKSFSEKQGQKNFLSDIFYNSKIKYNNFFDEIYEPLIFEGLNNLKEENFFDLLKCKLPQFNISLFEPIKDYDWRKTKITISNNIFEKIFSIFSRYNFTAIEEKGLDQDIAVDPEMLGKILENLMEKDERRLMGVFYTPKNIVFDMCKNSIVNYLTTKLDLEEIQKNEINEIIYFQKYELIDDDNERNFIYLDNNYKLIYQTLINIKVIDPAVGSGAFLVELLNILSDLLLYISKKYNFHNYEKKLKLKSKIIQNCLFGIDVNSTSIEIAKLRLWLNLIIDEKTYNKKKSLPNLEFNLLSGNSLSHETDLFSLKGLDEIEILREKYFDDIKNQKDIKSKYQKIINKYQKNNLINFEVCFYDIFKKKGGFDIVIANPPYEVLEGKDYKQEINRIKSIDIFEKACEGKVNYFKVFLLKSNCILNKNGVLTFIFQNSFLGTKNCTKLRELCFKENKVIKITSYPERDNPNTRVFKSAKMSVCILEMSKKHYLNYDFSIEVNNDKNKNSGFELTLNKNQVSKDIYLRIPQTSKRGLELYYNILSNKNLLMMKHVAKCFQGEVNLTTHKKFLSNKKDKKYNIEITRGANIQKFFKVYDTSQGESQFIDKVNFLKKISSGRAYSFENERIGMQNITGIQEKFRLKSAIISKNNFLGHSCNFLIKVNSEFSNEEIICYLNSNLLNWLFKIFSTISYVTTYEVDILPIIKMNAEQKIKIKDLYKKMIDLKLKNYKEISKDDNFELLMKNINEIIYDCFKISNEDRKFINKHFKSI